MRKNTREKVNLEAGPSANAGNEFFKCSNMHTRERPYGCIHCPKSLASKCILKNHLQFHIEKCSFGCWECPKLFKQ